MKPQLMPCPFCGGEAVVLGCGYGHRVECEICGSGTIYFKHGIDTDEESYRMAIEAWNRRVESERNRKHERTHERTTTVNV